MNAPSAGAQDRALREDTLARERALALASFLVEAPAGAGKTELLTQRFLRLLALAENPEEVLAITFTNKAAAEMQLRILDALRAAARGEPPAAPHRQLTFRLAGEVMANAARRGWRLLEQPSRLAITTIDALCAALTRRMPLLSRFGANPRVCEDASAHYREAARRTLAWLESEQAAYAEPVAAALAYLDNDQGRLAHLLASMLARRDQWLPAVSVEHDSRRALAYLIDQELEDIARTIDAVWETGLRPAARFAAETLLAAGTASPITALRDWEAPLPPLAGELAAWRGLAELLLTGKGEWRKSFTIAVGIPPGAAGKPWKTTLTEALAAAPDGLAARLARVRTLPALTGRDEEEGIVRQFAALLKIASAHLWQVFAEAGETDFGEIAQRALAALHEGEDGAPSDLALRLDQKIRHLLVDEFQDTSPTQIGLLRRLTAGWSEGDGRTLFCVGDPMQSIYRFRKAEVGLFLRAASDGIGDLRLTTLRLTRNNRSTPAVIDWINAVFARLFPAVDDVGRGGIAYRPSAPTRAEQPGAGVFVHWLPPADDQAADDALEEGGDEPSAVPSADQAEARLILDLVEQTWADDPTRRVAILARARSHLAPLVAWIRGTRPQLRFSALELEPLADRPWIADLLSLFQALGHRADRVAWLAVLRSPLCGLRLADLTALFADDHQATVWSLLNDASRQPRLGDDGRARLAVFRRQVGDALAALGRVPLARLVEDLWRALGGPATLPDAAASREVEAFFALLGQLEARGRLERQSLSEALARLYAPPDPDGDPRLVLMTIHKAKGLEFDTVIVPGLHRRPRGDDPEMVLWDEVALPAEDGSSETSLIVAPMKTSATAGGSDEAPSAYDFLRRLERERGRHEDHRVSYVAATRAIRTLHLVGVLGRDREGVLTAPARSALAELWPALDPVDRQPLAREVAFPEKTCSPENGRVSWAAFVPRLVRQRLAFYAGEAAVGEGAGGDDRGREDRAPPADFGRNSPEAAVDAAVGTLVHRCLELMAKDGDAWTDDRLTASRAAWRHWLAARGVGEAALEAATARVGSLLQGYTRSELGRWVLTRRQDDLVETAMVSRENGAVLVIDRCFVDRGERWIIDYKSSPLSDEQRDDSDEGAAKRKELAERHRRQLARYAEVFADSPLPLRLAVVFIDGPHLVELSPKDDGGEPGESGGNGVGGGSAHCG